MRSQQLETLHCAMKLKLLSLQESANYDGCARVAFPLILSVQGQCRISQSTAPHNQKRGSCATKRYTIAYIAKALLPTVRREVAATEYF